MANEVANANAAIVALEDQIAALEAKVNAGLSTIKPADVQAIADKITADAARVTAVNATLDGPTALSS